MNCETLQIRIEEIAQNAVSSFRWIGKPVLKINRKVAFLLSTVGQKSQNTVVSHPSTPHFLSPFFTTFVTHPPKINELDTVVTNTTPVLRPWHLSKFGTCTKCHSDSSSACYFCYSQQHIVSSNPHINDAHFWKEQDSHTSRNEHCVTPKQALLAPSLHWYFFLFNLVVIFTSSTTRINCLLCYWQ